MHSIQFIETQLLHGDYENALNTANRLDSKVEKSIYLSLCNYLLGDYQTAKDNLLQHSEGLHTQDQALIIYHHLLNAKILSHLGENKQAHKILVHARDEINELMKEKQDNIQILGRYHLAQGLYYWNFGNFELAIHHYLDAKESFEHSDKFRLMRSQIGLGEAYRSIGKFNNSIEILRDLKNKANSFKNIHLFSLAVINEAIAEFNRGNIHLASELSSTALKNIASTKNLVVPSLAFNLNGNISYLKGSLQNSQKHYATALDFRRKSGDMKWISSTLSNIAKVSHEKGEFSHAMDYYEKAYKILEGTSNYLWESKPLFEIIRILSLQGNLIQAENYLTKLENVYLKSPNNLIEQYLNLAKGYYLQVQKRMEYQVESRKLFRKVIKGPFLNFENTKIAYLSLCKILILELKLFPTEDVFDEINQLLDNLIEIVKNQHSFLILVEIHLIQARLKILNGKYQEAEELLNHALDLTKSKELKLLKTTIKKEIQGIKSEIVKWEEIIDTNENLIENIKKDDINSYIDTLSTVVDRIY